MRTFALQRKRRAHVLLDGRRVVRLQSPAGGVVAPQYQCHGCPEHNCIVWPQCGSPDESTRIDPHVREVTAESVAGVRVTQLSEYPQSP